MAKSAAKSKPAKKPAPKAAPKAAGKPKSMMSKIVEVLKGKAKPPVKGKGAAKPAAKPAKASKPAAKPVKAAKPAKPAAKPAAKPVKAAGKPAPKPSKPVAKAAKPAPKPVKPAAKPAPKPVAKPVAAKPVAAKPVAAPAKPIAKVAPPKPEPAKAVPLKPEPKLTKQPEAKAKPVATPAPAGKSEPKAKVIAPSPFAPVQTRSDEPVIKAVAVAKDAMVASKGKKAAPTPQVMRKIEQLPPVVNLPANYKPTAKEPYMNVNQLEYFRRKLLAWRSDLVEESKQTIDNLRDEVRDIGDEAERATRETENSLELRTRDRYRKLISKIDDSLQRIEQGEYGYCVDTGDEIGLERLEARATAERTLDAQERWEHRQRQMGD